MALSIFKLGIASLLPVVASAFFYLLERKGSMNKLKYAYQQIIIGLVFGCISVVGTEWGIPLNGVMVNSRDAAPIAAGLLFGAPAGIIAGLIGGIERWFAVYWGAGTFTRLGCSLATAIAGFYAAFLRKVLFEDKKPTYTLALGCGAVMEVFHLNLIFVTNLKDATQAVFVVNTCLIPMVIANSVSVMLSVIVVTKMANEKIFYSYKNTTAPIINTIQKWLLAVISVALFICILVAYILQNNIAVNNASNLVTNTSEEVTSDIYDASDSYMLTLTRIIGREITYGKYNLNSLAEKYSLTEISIIDENGFITESSNPDYVGFDMSSGRQSAEFLCLLNGTNEYVQKYGPISQDASVYRKFAGVSLRKGFVQIGYDSNRFHVEIDKQLSDTANNRQLGTTGGVIILDEDLNIISYTKGTDSIVKKMNSELLDSLKNESDAFVTYLPDGNQYYVSCDFAEGYYVIAFYNRADSIQTRDVSVYFSLFSMVLIFAILFALIYLLLKKIVISQITQMTSSLSVISSGNLNEVVDVRSSEEFSSLSDDINNTVETLKRYISEAAARIDAELKFAKTIQESALPSVFPKRDDFTIYATMKTAKEVGGDFYDFYLTGEDTLNFLIADVSGKGIPAAMFMMRAKSVLKGETELGRPVNEVFINGNNTLCTGNDAGMFVTAWQGCLDLSTGHVDFANAGHNLPAIKKKGGKFELHKQKVNLVLAGMEDLPYNNNELILEPGDIIFLYTDGVTEATNANNELYGDDRLITALNNIDSSNPEDICNAIYEDLDRFVKEADQFDDITMVCLEYKGK